MGFEYRRLSQRRELVVPATLDNIPNFSAHKNCSPLSCEVVDAISNENERRFAALILTLKEAFEGTADAYHEPGKVVAPVLKKHTVPDFLLLARGGAYFFEVGSKIRETRSKALVGRKKTQRAILKETGYPVGVIGPTEIEELAKVCADHASVAANLLLYLASDDFDGTIANLREMTQSYLSLSIYGGSGD